MSARTGRATVVGGGITGLAAARSLATAGADVTLLEASDRLGGYLHTTPFAGRPAVDEAADAFLVRVPDALALAAATGLEDDLVAPAVQQAFIWHRGLHDIPAGTVLGVPGSVGPLLRTSLLSSWGKVRALIEPVLPVGDGGDSVGMLVRRHFGNEVHDRLVDALVGSIYAADTNELSLGVVTQLHVLAQRRSLLLGARRAARAARRDQGGDNGRVFASPRSGMVALATATADQAAALGAIIRTSSPVREIARDGEGWRVDGEACDDVIVACPPAAAAAALAGSEPRLAALLAELDAADVAIVTAAVDAAAWPQRLRGRSGYLVPRSVQRNVTAVSFASQKWAHLADGSTELLRISLGRADTPIGDMSDDDLVRRAIADVSRHLGVDLAPHETRISRWPRSFPQYRPGHLLWRDAVAATCPPGLAVAGASYAGIGVPACVASGERAAALTLARRGERSS